jgi:hypothetical protein
MPDKIQLSVDEATDLTRVLLAPIIGCNAMSDPAHRETIVANLPQNIQVTIGRSRAAWYDGSEIVHTCLLYPDGIDDLIDVIRQFEGDTNAMRALDRALDTQFQRSFTFAALANLRDIVARIGLSVDELRALYVQSQPGDTGFPREPQRLLVAKLVLRRLAEQTTTSGDGGLRYPLLTFVNALAALPTAAAQQGALKGWLDAQVAKLKPATIDPEAPGAAPAPGPLYLLIELEPRGRDSNRFNVRAWLCSRQESAGASVSYPGKCVYNKGPHKLDAMQKVVGEIFKNITDDLTAAQDELIIEVFLPLDLLLICAPEYWTIRDDLNLEIPLGFEYRVVVRSLERATKAALQPSWKRQWEIWKRLPPPRRLDPQRLILQPTQAELRKPLQLYGQLDKSDIIFLALPFLVDPGQDILPYILKAGTPFALCLRKDATGLDDVDQEFKQLLASGDPDALGSAIWQQRRAAMSSQPPRQGYNLTLLWDDFDRLPQRELKPLELRSTSGG